MSDKQKTFSELLSCPFCGGEAELQETEGEFSVVCMGSCLVVPRTFFRNTAVSAMKVWNRRAYKKKLIKHLGSHRKEIEEKKGYNQY